jgi:hypothetical protein
MAYRDDRLGAIMSLDEMMNQFRLASRELFNNYFRVWNPNAAEEPWLAKERFSEVEAVLFQQLVTEPLSIEYVEYGYLQPRIQVKALIGETTNAMLNRELDSGYWDYPLKEITNDATLLFISYFDWEQLRCRDNQYVRAQVESWPRHPEVVGKHALLDSNNLQYLLRDNT